MIEDDTFIALDLEGLVEGLGLKVLCVARSDKEAIALANAKLDLEIAEEWFPVEQESWQRLEKEEQARKPSRSVETSTSRRSTRR